MCGVSFVAGGVAGVWLVGWLRRVWWGWLYEALGLPAFLKPKRLSAPNTYLQRCHGTGVLGGKISVGHA